MLYPPFKKNAFERPSVRPSVCTSVRSSAHRFHSLLGAFLTNFLQLTLRVDIGKECPGIRDW